MQRTGPDSLEGCFIAFTICLISTLMHGIAGLSSVLFVACIMRYNVDRNHASLPFVLNSVIQAITGPFAGYVAKKFSVRTVVLFGSFLAFAGIGTCFFAESITEVIILWGIVFGIGFGSSTLLLPAVINEYFFKHRSKALGIYYLGSPIGFLIFPPIFEVLCDKYGLSGTFLFLSVINLHCVPLSLLLRQPNFKEDSANLPLSNAKKKVTYLSTNSRANHPQLPTFENKSMTTESMKNSDSCFKRSSLEFLWKEPQLQESENTANEHHKQYIFTLNKNYFCPLRRQYDSVRSYEKINGNCYKKLANKHSVPKSFASNQIKFDSKLENVNHVKDEHGNLIFDERQRNYEICVKFGNGTEENATHSPVNVREKSKSLKGTESCNFKILQPINSKNIYKECSTIYFGTNRKEDTLTNQKQNVKHQSNFYHVNDTETSNVNVLSCHTSHDNSYQSTCRISEISLMSQNDSIPLATDNNSHKKYSSWTAFFHNKSLLNMYINPIFIVMSVSNAIFGLQFSTLITIIIDFAKDRGIDSSYDKFIMMCTSVMGLCGMICFGWVTDGGYMTRNKFASLCLLIGSVSTAVLPLVIDFKTLMVALAVWCVSHSSFALLVPAILAEYLEKDIQAVAVSSANVLSGPLNLIIPPLIGYFRDEKGSYDYVFYLLSSLSLLNTILVFVVPYMARSRSKEDNTSYQRSCRT